MEHFTETSCRALTTQDCAPHLDDDDDHDDHDGELTMVRSESDEFIPRITGIGCLKTALLEVESHLAPHICRTVLKAKEFSLLY